MQRIKHIFIDRDGTLIRHIPYLCNPGQVEVLPTVVAGLTRLIKSKCTLYLHTNQSGVGRGFFSLADAHVCNDEMLKQIGLGSRLFQEICVCPEIPGQNILYRKPSPKFGLEIMAKSGAHKSELCYVGDNITDLITAKNLGCLGIGVNTGLHDLRLSLEEHNLAEAFPVFNNFFEAAVHISSHSG